MSAAGRRLLGLDPGLQRTGWGVITVSGSRLGHVASGIVRSDRSGTVAERLVQLHRGLLEVIAAHEPDEAVVEESFVNRNPDSTLKLGLARGAVLLAPGLAGLRVTEYAPNRVKKAVVGVGHADKRQVQVMVGRLLSVASTIPSDAADALAVAICHAHYAGAGNRVDGTPTDGMSRAIAAALAREAQRR